MPRRSVVVDPTFAPRLRELRAERSMSQKALAKAAFTTRSYVSELEHGVKTPGVETAKALDAALGANGELSALVALADGRGERQPVGHLPSRVDRPMIEPPRTVDAELVRTVPTISERQVQGAPEWSHAVDAPHGWAAMLRWGVPSDAITDAARSLADAKLRSSFGSPIDPQLIECVRKAAEGYRRAYHTVPASRLLPAALAHLDLVMCLRPADLPERERIPLSAAAGEMAALVGVLLALDASRYANALRYFDLAWTAARSTDDSELQAIVLGCRSFAISYGEGDHRAGLECADFAREVAADASPETRGWVAAVASERCASLGDLGGCRRRLDESQAALSAPNTAEASWRGIGGYDASKLRAYEGGDLMRLRRYRSAEPILNDALTRLGTEMARHRATALLDRAEVRFGLGEVDAGCEDAGLALALVTHVQHTGHLDRIESLARGGIRAGSRVARSLHRDVQLTKIDQGLSVKMGAA